MKEYFSHDYNAREDQKIKKLLFTHSWIGYGLYWAIIETLYNNGGYLELNYESIAFDMRTDKNLIDSLINDFGLFKIKGKIFFSESVLRRLNQRKVKSEKAKLSALSRWNKDDNNDANALRTECDSNAIKEKKRKEKEIINNIDRDVSKPFKKPASPKYNWRELKLIQDEEVDKLFKDFLETREQLKVPAVNSERAINSLIKTLRELSDNKKDTGIKLLEQSIKNSWKDIYPLKNG